jgi:hypothetical protein
MEFSQSWSSENPQIKAQIALVSDEVLLPGLQVNVFSLYPHMMESREKSNISVISSYRVLIPEAQSPNAITLGIKHQHRDFG